jgi:UDP-2,3-diacylglucosamine pyrophosphatase LpxH
VQSRISADAVLNLGDNVAMGKENPNEAYYSTQKAIGEIDDKERAFFVVGNHDYNNISGVSVERQKKEWILPDDAIYRMYGRLHENDVVWGSKEKVYYYKDFEEKKIRMIVLNTLDKPNDTVTVDGVEYEKYPWLPNIVSSDQVDWFIDEALDFSGKSDKASWSVLVLSHVTPAPNVEWNSASLGDLQNSNPQGAQIIKIVEAFVTGTSKSLSYTDTLYGGSATLDRNADFTAQGAIPVIGWLSGHCHIDTKTTINGITYVTTVAGYPDESIGTSQSMSGMQMIDGTYSAFGVDVMSVDKTARKVKLHRIGIGSDREWTY